MSARRRPRGARKMKAFSRIETMTNEGQFDRALKRKDQLILVEFLSVRGDCWCEEKSTARGVA